MISHNRRFETEVSNILDGDTKAKSNSSVFGRIRDQSFGRGLRKLRPLY